MIYKFDTQKKKELLNGRTICWLSNQMNFSKASLTNILNGKIRCKKVVAYCIVKICNSNKEINDYFLREGE